MVRPGIVYGGTRGIVGDLFRDAMNGLVRVIGTGDNRWPTVYDRDVADLYVRLAQRADASGVYHATDDSDDRVNDIVEAIAAHAPAPPTVRRMPVEEAKAKLGNYARGARARPGGEEPACPRDRRGRRRSTRWRATPPGSSRSGAPAASPV